MRASELLALCPWLEEDDDVSGADVVDTIQAEYDRLKKEEAKEGL